MLQRIAFCITIPVLASVVAASACAAEIGVSERQIISRIDDTKLITLRGNTPLEARSEKDVGRVPDGTPLAGLQLALRRPAAQQRALESLLRDQLDRKSPRYHRWLNAKEFGWKFGVAISDIDTIVAWLGMHGFDVTAVSKSRMVVSFSGTAGEVRDTFHTEIHRVRVHGENHITNMSDPQIPAALASAVSGVAWLNDFHPKPQYTGSPDCEPFDANGNANSTCYWVVPADLWKIYNFPLPSSLYTGAGQTIAVMEDATPFFGNGDWCAFRTSFIERTCSQNLFQVINPEGCIAPTGYGVQGEVAIDPEWASAAAPGADVVVATCQDNGSMKGYLIALEDYVDEYTKQIISISYGQCEADLLIGGNSVLNSVYEQAAAEGFSVFVAAGDGGAAGCDNYGPTTGPATRGIAVSGYASSPYVVAVGGTTYADWALDKLRGQKPSVYWSSNNGPYWGSALSYIPEIPWNSSCGNELISYFYTEELETYGKAGFCNNPQYQRSPYFFNAVYAGSGGPSACALSGGGGCIGYPKPSWQSGILGNPDDQVRDVPDVSIVAGGPEWGHALIYCDSSIEGQGCSNRSANGVPDSGTSFSAPIFAGIQALIDQHVGEQIGNPNVTYYAFAKNEYGQDGNSGCLSLNATAGNSCAFYDVSDLVVPGDGDSTNVVPCVANHGHVNNCYLDAAPVGVLSTSNSSYLPAYASQQGWDFATGIGTPNVSNLINNWPYP